MVIYVRNSFYLMFGPKTAIPLEDMGFNIIEYYFIMDTGFMWVHVRHIVSRKNVKRTFLQAESVISLKFCFTATRSAMVPPSVLSFKVVGLGED